MRRTVRSKYLEQRLVRAYVLLLLVPEDEDGLRTVSLGRYGHYDVRLVEIADDNPVTAAKSLWVELYAHDCQAVLDSCIPDDLEDAAIATEELISQARQLDESEVLNSSAKHIHHTSPRRVDDLGGAPLSRERRSIAGWAALSSWRHLL